MTPQDMGMQKWNGFPATRILGILQKAVIIVAFKAPDQAQGLRCAENDSWVMTELCPICYFGSHGGLFVDRMIILNSYFITLCWFYTCKTFQSCLVTFQTSSSHASKISDYPSFVKLSRMGSSHGGLWQKVPWLLVCNSNCKHRNPNSTLGRMFRDDSLGGGSRREVLKARNPRIHQTTNTFRYLQCHCQHKKNRIKGKYLGYYKNCGRSTNWGNFRRYLSRDSLTSLR